MGILSKYNKALSRFTFKAGEDFEYKSLESLYSSKKGANNLLDVKGLYINHKSKFGDAPVLVSDKFYVNLPKHLCDEVVEMIKDDDVVEAINNGKAMAEIYTYESNGKTCYSVNWVDVEEN